MVTREELKTLIDQVEEPRLELARLVLEQIVRPQTKGHEMPEPLRELRQYKNDVLQRFRETRRPGTLGTGGGAGFSSERDGVSFGRQSFHYWDDKALVYQSRQHFDSQEIEIMERLSFSPDHVSLNVTLEVSSDGHTVRHEDTFPLLRH